ncbi:bucky ball isoform X2 [Tachysurus fulvidraco]|uniref:bucky ball isoform X2 n=1 Tax=Tachysurus fulvidraco TaxID=1234273 RepID=UPI000F4E799D|nr:bucky ball isoform X2 [Tachysurus fulvidraco]
MEDVSHPSQSDVEQPHPPVNHNRPFFYVQPPTQPYFMYQWPMDPFGQYGFLGPAFPFGRPYMPPYQFMQHPGYVVPHAPMQPSDYRRVAPLFPSVASYDLRFRQHFQQMSMHRETTSSEAQTEPGDPVSKLMDCLEGLQACEKSGAVKESNAMFSSSPALVSYSHEVEKMNYGDKELINMASASHINKADHDLMEHMTLCDSAVYDAESSKGRLEECVLSDVLPLDSSSIRDEGQSRDQDYKRGDSERLCFHSEKTGTDHIGDGSRLAEVQDSGAHVSDCSGTSDLFEGKACIQNKKVENLPPDSVEVTKPFLQMTADYDLPYQILHLPSNKTTTGLLLQKEVDPLLFVDTASALLPSKQYTSGSPYPHSFYSPVVPARQSVLSPSLDELSSRDEMFSTDIEDDLTSGQAYVDGGKLEEAGAAPSYAEMDPADEACSMWVKTCACCGASLPDISSAEPFDQDRDFELEEDTEAQSTGEAQKILKQHLSRHRLSSCAQVSKHKARKVHDIEEPSGKDQDHGRGECGEQHHPAAKGDKGGDKGQKVTQFRSYSEHFQRECPGGIMDQENWTSGKQRSRSCRPANALQDKGRPARKSPTCKTFAQQRPRRNEYDHNEAGFSFCQMGREEAQDTK